MQSIAYLHNIFSSRKEKTVAAPTDRCESTALMSEICDVLKQLDNINNRFDYETESDMIDACIFEQQALLSRYRHLLSIARRNSVTCTHASFMDMCRNDNL